MSALYLKTKRSVGYAEEGGYRFCRSCQMTVRPIFDGIERLQCRVIGVADDRDADVRPGAHCKSAWKGRVM
ncbi:MAG: hypothetical protein IMZ69_11935 [Spirochaetes bacterium]|nr:hypothetical protein [Spirochaetota bacterium]